MISEIISIGDELLVGQVVNTNATWMAQHLHEIGIPVKQISAISDDAAEITRALDVAFARADVILVTGGLGPTKDDITKHTLCSYFGTELVFHQPSYENIRKFFASRGMEVTGLNRKQAEVPANCTPLINHNGTAPGMWFEKEGKILVSLPGVPFEMEAMMEEYILPRLASQDNQRVVAHKTILTQGIGESFLSEMIKDWEEDLPSNMKLAYLPQPGLVRLRLTAYGETKEKTLQEIENQVESLQKLIPDLIFGYGNDTMEEIVGRLLKEKHCTLSTAESCTGGFLAHMITSVPGASDYFQGSVIAYSNEIKHTFLGVSEESLKQFGAVSEQVVKEMARGARQRFNTDFAVSISGIAGPDGGTIDKPVGTVWIAIASKTGVIAQKFMFGEHRGRNILRAALAALNLLRLAIGS
ncbi:MAG: competence/damage-inducible protein A [Bacteroidales bacterium]|nr:competence/damage-inducible protein A [Bacteroidales bacterium]